MTIYTHILSHTPIPTYTFYAYAMVHSHSCLYVCVCVCVCVYICMYVYICVCIYTYTYIHIYTYTIAHSCLYIPTYYLTHINNQSINQSINGRWSEHRNKNLQNAYMEHVYYPYSFLLPRLMSHCRNGEGKSIGAKGSGKL